MFSVVISRSSTEEISPGRGLSMLRVGGAVFQKVEENWGGSGFRPIGRKIFTKSTEKWHSGPPVLARVLLSYACHRSKFSPECYSEIIVC